MKIVKTPMPGNSKDAMSPRMKAKFKAYKPRERAPNEATGYAINLWKLPTYTPEPMRCIRLESRA